MDHLEFYKKIFSKQKIYESKANLLQREVIIRWLNNKLTNYCIINTLDISNKRDIFFSCVSILDNYINKSNDKVNHLVGITCLFISLKMETVDATFKIDFFVHCIIGYMQTFSYNDVTMEIIKTEKKILNVLKFELHHITGVNNFLHLLFELNDEKNNELKEITWYIAELSLYSLPKITPSLLAISAYILSKLKIRIEYDTVNITNAIESHKLIEMSLHNYNDVRKSVVFLNKMVTMDNEVYKDYIEIPIKKYFK